MESLRFDLTIPVPAAATIAETVAATDAVSAERAHPAAKAAMLGATAMELAVPISTPIEGGAL